MEIEASQAVKKKLLMEQKEEDYMDSIEEKFKEKSGIKQTKERSRLLELTSLICSNIRENLNQEEGILCLGFLEHIIN